MNFQQLTDKANSIIEQISDTKIEFKEIIINQEISLEERWEIFKKYGYLFGETRGWCWYPKIEMKVSIEWYDDFYIQKTGDVILSDIVERIEESLEDEYDDNLKKKWTKELLDEFKEEIMKDNKYSFTYDW